MAIYTNNFCRIFTRLLAETGVTCYKIYQYTGIDESYLSQLKSGEKKNPGPEIIIKIYIAITHFKKEIKRITKQSIDDKKQKLAQEKARKKEARRTDKTKSEARSKQEEKKTSYTAVIITKLEYEGADAPSKEQLAEDLGNMIIKWAETKGFYAINSKEPIPTLVSVDVDIQ